MIVNISKSAQSNDIVSFIKNSQEEFFLTGSRFFGGWNENSDTDYFVRNSKELLDKLLALGGNLDLVNYINSSISHVVLFEKEKIHIQLINDTEFEKKKRMQDLLNNKNGRYLLSSIPKKDRKVLWNLVSQIIG